jgi:hypothetical protein
MGSTTKEDQMTAIDEARELLFEGAVHAAVNYLGSAWEDVPLLKEQEFLTLRDEITEALKSAYYQPRHSMGATE